MDHRHGAPLFYALVHVGMEEFVFATSGRKVPKPQNLNSINFFFNKSTSLSKTLDHPQNSTQPQDPNSINKFLTKNTSRSKTLDRPQNSKLPLIVEKLYRFIQSIFMTGFYIGPYD